MRPLPCGDALDHAVEPARAFAARRALAAAFVHVEVRQAQQALDHAAGVVHHDHRARAEHRAGLGDGSRSPSSLFIITSAGSTGDDEPPGITAFSVRPSRTPPASSSSLRERRAQRHLEVAGPLHVTDDREDLGAAVVRLADLEVGLRRRCG